MPDLLKKIVGQALFIGYFCFSTVWMLLWVAIGIPFFILNPLGLSSIAAKVHRQIYKIVYLPYHWWMVYAIRCLTVTAYGDMPRQEDALIFMNHIAQIDFAPIFTIGHAVDMQSSLRVFAKQSIMWIPGIGQILWMIGAVFIKRQWEADKARIDECFAHLLAGDNPFWLMSFVEGTRRTPAKAAEAQAFAKKRGLPFTPNHTLVPRIKGAAATLAAMRERKPWIYDVTLWYGDSSGPHPIDIIPLLSLERTADMHALFNREPFPEHLFEGPEDEYEKRVGMYLYKLWDRKERDISYFIKHGRFQRPLLDVPKEALSLANSATLPANAELVTERKTSVNKAAGGKGGASNVVRRVK